MFGWQSILLAFLLLTSLPSAAQVTLDTTEFNRIFTHHTTMANGIKLHYVTGGKGEPIVLLHGNPETWQAWRKVMPALSTQYTLVVPDLRGLGESERPASGYDKRTMAEDIFELMRGLGYSRFSVVGHDFGGSIAYALAALHPTVVKKLAVIECLPAGLLTDEPTLAALGKRLEGRTWFQAFGRVPDLPEKLVAGREEVYLSWLFEQFNSNPGSITQKEKQEYIRAYRKPGAMRASFNLYRAEPTDREDNHRFMQTKLTVPVLAIGADNVFANATAMAMRAACINVQEIVLENCGHFVPEEKPQELTHLLITFLGAKTPPQ